MAWQPRSSLHNRWLLAVEALAAQGMPVWPEYTDGVALCSFASEKRPSSSTSRTAVIGQAGNAMHVEVCAIAILFAITQIEKPHSGLRSNSMLGRLAAKLAADYTD